MFPFGCVFCLSRLEGRNINMSNVSIKKMFWDIRFHEWKIAEGNPVMWGTRLQPKMWSIYFNTSCRKRFNSWIFCLLHCYIDGLLWRKNGNRNLKNRRDFLDQLTGCRLTCGPKKQWESELVSCSQKQVVYQRLFLKHSNRIITATENGVMTSR